MAGLSYVVCTQIPPPSALRLAVYESGGRMVGPDNEPADWKTLDPIRLSGTSFGNRQIEVECAVRGLVSMILISDRILVFCGIACMPLFMISRPFEFL